MQVATSEQNGMTILSLTGRMDATTANVFGDACKAALDGGARRIVVDLSGIEYISSAGLRVILTMLKVTRSLKGTLAFSGLQPMVSEVFRISGFNSMLPTYATTADALAALA